MTQMPGERRAGHHPCLCFNLRHAARKLSAFYDSHLDQVGLTAAQFALLAEIGADSGAPISEIAERLALDPSTLSRTLRPLETAALLEIQQDAKNRRLRRVQLTETGRGKLRQAVLAWHEAQAAAMAAIPEGVVQALLEGSDRLPPAATAARGKQSAA
jgi:DNA-binding MarR family transcriptional regulator